MSKYQAVIAISSDGVLPMSMNPELQDALLKGKRKDPYYIANGAFDLLKDTNLCDFLPEDTGLFVFEAQDYDYQPGTASETRHPIHVRFHGVKVYRLPASSYAVLWGAILDSDNDTAPKSAQGAQDCASEGA